MQRLSIKVLLGISLLSTQLAFAVPARFGLSPDNSRDLIISTIESAKKDLVINIYDFEDLGIAEAVVDQIKAGIKVSILFEGQPLPNLSPRGKQVILKVRDAMRTSRNRQSHLYLMIREKPAVPGTPSGPTRGRRYTYNHAKYIIVDQKQVLVSTENFNSGAHAANGEVGNRGWQTVVSSPELAAELLKIFKVDADPKQDDLVEIGPNDSIPNPALPDDLRSTPEAAKPRRPVQNIPAGDGDVAQVDLYSSPNALAGIKQFIKKAKRTLDIEKASLPSQWRESNSQPTYLSPWVEAIVESAQRGVSVRVLLNDESVYGGNPNEVTKNEATVEYFLALAECHDLPIDAKIVDVKAAGISYIHNKGMLADSAHVWVSSINGTRNSVVFNREIAVHLQSLDAGKYYGEAFDLDWKRSPSYDARNSHSACPPLPSKMKALDQFFFPMLISGLPQMSESHSDKLELSALD